MKYVSIAESRAGKKSAPKKGRSKPKPTPETSVTPAASTTTTTNGGEAAHEEES